MSSDEGDIEEGSLRAEANAARRAFTAAQPERTRDGRKKKLNKGNTGGFQSMGLSYPVYKGVMHMGYKVPTPIQRKSIPLILDGKDMVAMARTGSGKTASFIIPMLEKLRTHSARVGVRGLILSPTRELALQTLKFTKSLMKHTDLRSAVILGGDSMDQQFADLHGNPDIVIATPGRLLHVVVEMELVLSTVEYVVFDEADRLFEMGFAEQLNELLARLPQERQTVLFSATLPKLLVDFARAGLQDPTLVRLDVETKLSENLKMQFFGARRVNKIALLLFLLRDVIEKGKQSVVFVATKHHVEYLAELLTQEGHNVTYSYGAMDPTARKINVAKFRAQKADTLIVTDVAARGIDIPLLDYVINFDFPTKPKLFVHRVGRVARAGRSGIAFNLVSADEVPHMLDLHLFLGRGVIPAKPMLDDGTVLQADVDAVYGHAPQILLDLELERIRARTAMTHGLSGAYKTMFNAYKMYDKSRAEPSPQSCIRAKEIEAFGVATHPMLASAVGSAEIKRQDLVAGIANYRPAATIFEQGKNIIDPKLTMMAKKREAHSKIILKQKQALILAAPLVERERKASDHYGLGAAAVAKMEKSNPEAIAATFSDIRAPGRNKEGIIDETAPREPTGKIDLTTMTEEIKVEPRISSRPAGEHVDKHMGVRSGDNGYFEDKANAAIFDMDGDDDGTIKKNQNRMKWDRKKKRYVQEGSGMEDAKRIKTESGNYIKASYKGTKYAEWKDRNNADGNYVGGEEQARFANAGQSYGRGRGRGRFALGGTAKAKTAKKVEGGGGGRGHHADFATGSGSGRGRGRGRGGGDAGGVASRGGELISREFVLKNRKSKAKEAEKHEQNFGKKGQNSKGKGAKGASRGPRFSGGNGRGGRGGGVGGKGRVGGDKGFAKGSIFGKGGGKR